MRVTQVMMLVTMLQMMMRHRWQIYGIETVTSITMRMARVVTLVTIPLTVTRHQRKILVETVAHILQ